MSGTASTFLTLSSGIPELVEGVETSGSAGSGLIPALNSSSVLDASIGGTGAATLTAHSVLVGEGTSPVAFVGPGATAGVPLVSNGGSADPHFSTAVVAGGGTGAVTLTNHGVLLGQGTSAVVATSAGTASYVLTSNGASSDPTFQPAPTGAPTASILASEDIAAGSLVNVYNNSGTANVRNADNTSSSKYANGTAVSAISNSSSGLVTFGAVDITGLSGLTIGQLFLGTTGGATSTAPSSSGDVVQLVGLAISATEAIFNPGQNYNLA